jgi:hypothetical protein
MAVESGILVPDPEGKKKGGLKHLKMGRFKS